jgi:hypothetical protein
MFAPAYITAFIDDRTPDGRQVKKLAEDNLEAACNKDMRT